MVGRKQGEHVPFRCLTSEDFSNKAMYCFLRKMNSNLSTLKKQFYH